MWLIQFLKSSIGKKLIMSLTGLFLILFLIIHLIGNLQLLYSDGGKAFNTYAHFMTTNPLIKFTSFGLYFFILLHAVQGIILWLSNKGAKGSKYSVSAKDNATWASKNMALLGMLVLAFLCIHMGDFWFRMKIGWTEVVTYEGYDYPVKDLYDRVVVSFSKLWIVLIYLIGMIALALHLHHGFSSAFQTLGINHKKYTPIIKAIGTGYAIIIPLLFAIIPVFIFFTNR